MYRNIIGHVASGGVNIGHKAIVNKHLDPVHFR